MYVIVIVSIFLSNYRLFFVTYCEPLSYYRFHFGRQNYLENACKTSVCKNKSLKKTFCFYEIQ